MWWWWCDVYCIFGEMRSVCEFHKKINEQFTVQKQNVLVPDYLSRKKNVHLHGSNKNSTFYTFSVQKKNLWNLFFVLNRFSFMFTFYSIWVPLKKEMHVTWHDMTVFYEGTQVDIFLTSSSPVIIIVCTYIILLEWLW